MAVAWGFDDPPVWRDLRQWIVRHPPPDPRRGRRERRVQTAVRHWVPVAPAEIWHRLTTVPWTSTWDPALGWLMSRWIPQADRERDQLAVWQVILSPDPACVGAWAWSGVARVTRWAAVWEPAWGRVVPVVLSRRGGPDGLDDTPAPGHADAWRDWLVARGWITPRDWLRYTDPEGVREAGMWRVPVVW